MSVKSDQPTPLIYRLSKEEIAELLALGVPAHLATVDPRGFPRITPILGVSLHKPFALGSTGPVKGNWNVLLGAGSSAIPR